MIFLISLIVFAGLVKAIRDRALEPQLWAKTWIPIPDSWRRGGFNLLWWEIDVWHVMDWLNAMTLILIGLILGIEAEFWVFLVASFLLTCIYLTAFTLFYHFLLLKDPILELKRFKEMYFG